MSEADKAAVAWAVYSLKDKYEHSKKALDKHVLALMAQENIRQYEHLKAMLEDAGGGK